MASTIECRVPTQMTVWALSEADLEQRFKFKTKDFSVEAAFEYSTRHKHDDPSPAEKAWGEVYGLTLSLIPDPAGRWPDNKLTDALKTPEGQKSIVDALLAVANHFFRTLRVYGNVVGLDEFRFRSSKIESQLRRLKVRIQIGEYVFEPPKGDGLIDLFGDLEPARNAYFTTRRADPVVEALQDGRAPEPEDEFLINAIEFLEDRNLRMAIVECTIALEMALARYLPAELIRRGISAKEAKSFLSPELGLTKKITVVLPLLGKLDGVDLSKVKDLISSRNRIIHKTGFPADNVTYEVVSEQVGATENLISRLRYLRGNAELEPERKVIAEAVGSEQGVVGAVAMLRENHGVSVEITIFGSQITDAAIMKMIENISKAASARDARYREKDHLIVKIGQLLRPPTGVFVGGKLHRVDEQIEK